MVGIISNTTQINMFSQNNAKLIGSIGLNKSSISSSNTGGVNDSVKSESNLKNSVSAYFTKYSTNLSSTNNINSVKVASLDRVEISSESRQLFAAKSSTKSSNSLLDIAKNVVDIATDFIPGIGTAKDVYNLYETITDSKSTTKDIALAVADLVPGPSLTKLKKLADVIIDKFDLNSSASKKLKNALTQTSAKNIKDMSTNDTKKLIDLSEKGAGHALRDHVNIDDTGLQDRLRKKAEIGKPIPAATKFSTKTVMANFVNSVLDKEADKIASWLNSSIKADFVSSPHKSSTSLGHGYTHNADGRSFKKITKLDTGQVILRKADNEYGFMVLTAYPVIK